MPGYTVSVCLSDCTVYICVCVFVVVQCESNVDYIVCNKVVMETILDAEFKTPIDKGFFYTGNSCRNLLISYPIQLPIYHVPGVKCTKWTPRPQQYSRSTRAAVLL